MNAPSPEVLRHPDKQATADAAAAQLVSTLATAQREGREPQVALTGGSMGSAIIASVLARPDHADVDWSRVTVWWGDERYLPAGDSERNDTQNDAAGLGSLGLDPTRVHRVGGPDRAASVEASAQAYGDLMRQEGGGEFEVVMFGVGPDGHVASLFPHHPAQRISDRIAVAVHDSPKPPPDRVSLTFEALNHAREVWFLVAGEDKAQAVAAALTPGADRWDVPASGVSGGTATRWFVDEAAAADLS
ncbi:6-phosphogluconolactonase [Luteipulveratus sp. YIM 133132]|uniref:6-phosphogluconolactonase n=1 Tax=Luteipulveratus flavus TaxID=3031728 RepID=UPI0023AF0627|nr:6-phosphogluconolactonase [Luteipulveratus sp. YIM 133132]MDE9364508.1 6-phosphogluconolactonase [Luteipulveratus sp. YIM 133132]